MSLMENLITIYPAIICLVPNGYTDVIATSENALAKYLEISGKEVSNGGNICYVVQLSTRQFLLLVFVHFSMQITCHAYVSLC